MGKCITKAIQTYLGTIRYIQELSLKAATGSCSYEKVFLTISSPGIQRCSEYILVQFLMGN